MDCSELGEMSDAMAFLVNNPEAVQPLAVPAATPMGQN
jgi:hypothetical protein